MCLLVICFCHPPHLLTQMVESIKGVVYHEPFRSENLIYPQSHSFCPKDFCSSQRQCGPLLDRSLHTPIRFACVVIQCHHPKYKLQRDSRICPVSFSFWQIIAMKMSSVCKHLTAETPLPASSVLWCASLISYAVLMNPDLRLNHVDSQSFPVQSSGVQFHVRQLT